MESKPVGIWIRVSTEDQAKGESPENHEKRARYYAESKGWDIKEVYHLEAVSGKSVMGHPEAKRMLNDIGTGHITGLIFSKLARLARNTRELLEFSDIFREHSADLISLQEAIDTSTPAGRLFYTMIAAMAQWEREEIASRIAASVPIRAKLGKLMGGAPIFGYCKKDKKLIPDPKEAAIVKLMFEMYLEQRRKRTVARMLNDKGFRTRNGGKFSCTSVTRIITDPTFKGLHRLNYTKSLGENKKWVLKPKEDWVILKVEPIVSEELWNQCNAAVSDQYKKYKKPAKKAVHLFAGFVFCHCGKKMYVPSDSPKYTCQKCRNKIPVADLEAIFQEQLKNFFFSPSEIAKHMETADKVIKEKQELLNAMEEERRKVVKEKDMVYRSYIDQEIDVKTYGAQFRPLTARLEQIENQIPEVQGEMDFLKIELISTDEIINESKDLYSKWNELLFEEKRKITENITKKITIGKDDVSIQLSYLPASSEMTANKQRNLMYALPFCEIHLHAKKPLNPAYPKSLNTIGDHIKKRRLDLGLTQRQLASRLEVKSDTIVNWEKNYGTIMIHLIPRIIDFLGYVPFNTDFKDLKDKLIFYRKLSGLSQEKLAALLQVDESTVASWEKGEHKPSKKLLYKLKILLTAISVP